MVVAGGRRQRRFQHVRLFFFQAEDGIRDYKVTGVQTCALPIFRSRTGHPAWRRWGPYLSERAWGTVREDYSSDGDAWAYLPHDHARSRAYRWNRSEERRVGKEGRSRWSPYH